MNECSCVLVVCDLRLDLDSLERAAGAATLVEKFAAALGLHACTETK